jgi:hypothetical protein
MMRAELKRLHSPDAWDLSAFMPLREGHFGLFIEARVGPAGEDSEESFGFTVCTPAWLAEQVEMKGPLLGRHHVVVAVYDYGTLERFVRASCEACTGATWRPPARRPRPCPTPRSCPPPPTTSPRRPAAGSRLTHGEPPCRSPPPFRPRTPSSRRRTPWKQGGDVKVSTLQRYCAAIGEKLALAV